MQENYQKLEVWKKSMDLVEKVYQLMKKLPKEEMYALSDQMRRAAVSIPSNIAEGSGRSSNADYAHFLSIARGSLYETMTQLRVAVDLGYISSLSENVNALIDEVGRMLGAMLKKYGTIRCSTSTSNFD